VVAASGHPLAKRPASPRRPGSQRHGSMSCWEQSAPFDMCLTGQQGELQRAAARCRRRTKPPCGTRSRKPPHGCEDRSGSLNMVQPHDPLRHAWRGRAAPDLCLKLRPQRHHRCPPRRSGVRGRLCRTARHPRVEHCSAILVTQGFGWISHCRRWRTWTCYLMLSHVRDFGAPLRG